MLKETGYQEKFAMLSPYLQSIIETVKKDLKKEHWNADRKFCAKYFFGKNPSQVPIETVVEAYATEIAEGNVGLGEFIASRWLLKNTDIYGYFEKQLSGISNDFDELDTLNEEQARPLLEGSVQEYGWKLTYMFSVLNSVVFPEQIYDELKQKAQTQAAQETNTLDEEAELKQVEALKRRHVREITALKDRFEKKLSGFQKKYLADTEALKKQIKKLQETHGAE